MVKFRKAKIIMIVINVKQLQAALKQICRSEQCSLMAVCVRVRSSLPVHEYKREEPVPMEV
jgi:hypothetical protein